MVKSCNTRHETWDSRLLCFQLRDVDPLALGPGLHAFLGQLDDLGAFEQCPTEGFGFHDVPQEKLPLHLERVVELTLFGDFLPAVEEVDGLGCVGIPDRARCGAVGLDPGIAQAGDGRAERAIHV